MLIIYKTQNSIYLIQQDNGILFITTTITIWYARRQKIVYIHTKHIYSTSYC